MGADEGQPSQGSAAYREIGKPGDEAGDEQGPLVAAEEVKGAGENE